MLALKKIPLTDSVLANDPMSILEELEKNHLEILSQMRRLAVHQTLDSLTGLPRREAFDGELHDIYSLILIDLDYFKSINDRFGHPAGDEVLREVGMVLKSLTRFHSKIKCARLGGEEFAIWSTEPIQDQIIIKLSEFIRRAIASLEIHVGQLSISVTASLGVGFSPHREVAVPVKQLYLLADKALYEAKTQGRDRVYAGEFKGASEVT